MTEDLIKERIIQDAISAFKEYKVADRWISDALLTVLNYSLDKNGNLSGFIYVVIGIGYKIVYSQWLI